MLPRYRCAAAEAVNPKLSVRSIPKLMTRLRKRVFDTRTSKNYEAETMIRRAEHLTTMPVGGGAQLRSVLQMVDSGARVEGKQVNLPEAAHKLTVRSSADELSFHMFATHKEPCGGELHISSGQR